nr:hypothetical protein GCM10020093_092180 [Planobispora longispora]
MLARVSATYRFLAFGAIGVGGVVGGLAGDWFGLRPAMFFCIIALVAGWLVFARFLPGAVKQFEDSERAAEAGARRDRPERKEDRRPGTGNAAGRRRSLRPAAFP